MFVATVFPEDMITLAGAVLFFFGFELPSGITCFQPKGLPSVLVVWWVCWPQILSVLVYPERSVLFHFRRTALLDFRTRWQSSSLRTVSVFACPHCCGLASTVSAHQSDRLSSLSVTCSIFRIMCLVRDLFPLTLLGSQFFEIPGSVGGWVLFSKFAEFSATISLTIFSSVLSYWSSYYT